MKGWAGALTMAVSLTLGSAAIDPAIAAEATVARQAITTTQRHAHPAYRHVRTAYRAVEQPRYLGRPVYYVPAPFPLGFGFGFFW